MRGASRVPRAANLGSMLIPNGSCGKKTKKEETNRELAVPYASFHRRGSACLLARSIPDNGLVAGRWTWSASQQQSSAWTTETTVYTDLDTLEHLVELLALNPSGLLILIRDPASHTYRHPTHSRSRQMCPEIDTEQCPYSPHTYTRSLARPRSRGRGSRRNTNERKQYSERE